MVRRSQALAAALLLVAAPAAAQQGPPRPPAVGVIAVARAPIFETNEFVGRIQATDRVNLVARVSAFIDKRFFTEGAEVKKNDLLYRLEQGPFQADVQAKQAAVAQFDAQLQNAKVTLSRAEALLHTPAGQQSNVDLALSQQLALQAQIEGAQAQLKQSEINLAYTEIRAPIDGKIGRTAMTEGNVVGPNSGTLATIVSQDPMYVVFPVSVRTALDLRERLAGKGGLTSAVVHIRLPNGETYGQTGKVDFVDNTVTTTTDTITLRGVVPNPVTANGSRELVDNEIVSVVLEAATPVEALTVPREAVLADQRGDYVYVVDGDNTAQQRRIQLGQSTPTMAVVSAGLAPGEHVIVEGIQRVRPGQQVSPASASSSPGGAAPPRAQP